MEPLKKLLDGMDMSSLFPIEGVGRCDQNYYVFEGYLLLAHTDEELGSTDWYLLDGVQDPAFIGVSQFWSTPEIVGDYFN